MPTTIWATWFVTKSSAGPTSTPIATPPPTAVPAITDYVIDTERWMLRAPARETLLDHAGNLVTRADYHYDDESFDVEAARHDHRARQSDDAAPLAWDRLWAMSAKLAIADPSAARIRY